MLTSVTILAAVVGGLLIGSAAGLLLLLSGRIAGVSGMAAAALRIADRGPPWAQAAAFTVGLPLGAAAVALAFGRPSLAITSSLPLLIGGGLLVGFGTRLGNGCTSGHGVCGLARLSPRSLMRHALPGLVVGVLFGAGLALSGMTNPARVLGFLDVAGKWDPTLAFVLAAALVPSSLAYLAIRRMERPVMAEEFCIPQNRAIETRLLAGAGLFGIGWGLVGLCPGPALAGLAFGAWQIWVFAAAMIAGMALQRLYADLRDHRPFHLAG